MKRVLITGKDSYIGTNFKKYLEQYSDEYYVEELDVRDDTWKEYDFTSYDVVFHVAGIAHIKEKKENKNLYYKVNRDLAYEVAKKSKESGVKQYIFMSSMSVYGLQHSIEPITRKTIPNPNTYYGKSKLEAEQLILKLENNDFKICIVRPPMIYGPKSKGNYQLLSKFAKKTPIFATIENKRSMLFLENLMEFVKLMIDNEEIGTFLPQNDEYVSSRELVKIIAELYNHKIILTSIFNPLLKLCSKQTHVSKVFGSLMIDKETSKYKQNYNTISFTDSIKATERNIQ